MKHRACVCVCVCVCARARVCEMTKEMAGSTRHLPTKQNTLIPSVATKVGFIIQPQSCYVREYL